MIIGASGRFLAKPFTGIGQHTRFLFTALAKVLPSLKIIMVTHEPVSVEMPPNVHIEVLKENFPGTAGMRKTYWEQRQVPRFLKERQVDLAHFPYPCNPWTGFEKPVCVTVHDAIPWLSEAYRRSVTTRLYQDSCRFAVKKADHVFTVSEASKYDVAALCHIEESKISLSYNAPAPQFFMKIDADERAKVLAKYGLNPARRYFFYVGGYDERKNVPMILQAFEKFVAARHDIDLVLAGGKAVNDPLYASFDNILRGKHTDGEDSAAGGGHAARPGAIHTTGFVEESDLPALYQSAFAFVNVSQKEGCNLPLLEALASGVPVITSDIPVHHEMVGHHAAYVGASDADRLGEVMDQFLRDDQFYFAHKQDAMNYRCPFSWEKTAEGVLGVYERLAGAR